VGGEGGGCGVDVQAIGHELEVRQSLL
jgi:hypothetical protein